MLCATARCGLSPVSPEPLWETLGWGKSYAAATNVRNSSSRKTCPSPDHRPQIGKKGISNNF